MVRRGTVTVLAGACSGVATAMLFTLRAHELGYPLWEYYHHAAVGPAIFALLLGTIPAVALVRYGLVAPTLVLGFAISVWLRAASNPLPGTSVVLVLYGLLSAYLLAVVCFAWFEFALRSRVELLPSPG